MIKLTFLGTSDAIPTSERNHTAMLLAYSGENILVDCGEGTQRQLRKAKINPNTISKILITHWHGDHVLGLPGLLQTLNFSGRHKALSICGPKGTKNYVSKTLDAFAFQGKFDISVKEVSGRFFENSEFYLEAEKMIHGTFCNAYSFVRKGLIKIDKKKLQKTKITGPVLKELKAGKDVVYEGKKYLAKNLTFIEDEKKIAFVFDTAFNDRIVPFAQNSDLLVCESTFGEELEEKAEKYKHLTVRQAAEIAKKSKAKKLILTHISQRYSKNPGIILNAAKKIFRNSFLAKDFDVFEI
jgi:ribonuclease Z